MASTDSNANDLGQRRRIAATEGSTLSVRSLLEKGAGVNEADPLGRTPLYLAARDGHAEVVKALIAAGAALDPKVHGDPEAELEELAGRPTYKEIVAGATTVTTSRGSRYTEIDMGKVWVETQRQGEFPSWRMQTPLMVAARRGHEETLRALIAAGADVNARGEGQTTPLHLATQVGQSGSVRILLEAGADPGLEDSLHRLPLFLAIETDNEPLQGLLRPVTPTRHDLRIVELVAASRQGRVEQVRSLLASGLRADAADPSGNTALFQAVMYDHPDVARVLLAGGADMHLANFFETPLSMSCKHRRVAILKVFAEAGVRLSEKARASLIDWARKRKFKEVVKLLEQIPIDPIFNRELGYLRPEE